MRAPKSLAATILFAGLSAHAALVELKDVVQLEAGGAHSCVLTTSGAVKCWGMNDVGQLGDGTTNARHIAADVPGLGTGNVEIAVSRGRFGFGHTCTITEIGGVKCWGNNEFGQLGDGTATTTPYLSPVDVVGLSGTAVGIAAGRAHTCAILSGGAVQCWGRNDAGQLGDGSTVNRPFPANVPGLSGIVEVSAAMDHTCAVNSAGAAKCWGGNEAGQLGDGTVIARSTPVDVSSLPAGVMSISAGGAAPVASPGAFWSGGHTCAVIVAGAVKCWGFNGVGQLGDGTYDDHLTPFEVLGLNGGMMGISAGGASLRLGRISDPPTTYAHTCAVTASGRAKCWGSAGCGQLGDGTGFPACSRFRLPNSNIPVDVVGLSAAASISAGGVFTCALTSAGRVNCWGERYATYPLPILTGTLAQSISIANVPANVSVGESHSFIVTGGTSGNPVTLTSLTPSTCTVGSNSVQGVSLGVCSVAANQAGDVVHDPAPQVVVSFRIGDPVAQTITFGTAPAVVVNGVGVLDAQASSFLPVSFTSNTPSTCSVSANVVTGLAVGSCTVAASQPGNNEYGPAPEVTQTFAIGPATGLVGLTVTKSQPGWGTVTSEPAGIDCGSTCAGNFTGNSAVSLSAVASEGFFFSQWTGACSGSGGCNVTMNAPKTVGATFLRNPSPSKVANISTRGVVATGNDVMIAGFVVSGTSSVVVRVRGPSLVQDGVQNVLNDPTLRLVRSSDQETIAVNDNWASASNLAQLMASGFAPPGAAESAILVVLPPGAYTAVVSGADGGTGVAIVEVFHLSQVDSPLANISTRGQVLTGDHVMIAGFIIHGEAPQTVVIRARGPSLASFGITNFLSNPVLQLYAGPDLFATSDNWGSAPNAGEIANAGFAPGDTAESAIMVTLNPGAYTAIVTGAGGGTGVGIVEVFALP